MQQTLVLLLTWLQNDVREPELLFFEDAQAAIFNNANRLNCEKNV